MDLRYQRDHLRDQEIGIMADWLDSERPRGFDFRQTDRQTDISYSRAAFVTDKYLFYSD